MSIKRMPLAAARGLTLIELIIFMVIVGIALAGILGVLAYTNRNSADPQTAKQALAIAEGLLEEVEHARFTFCDPADPVAETAASTAACTVKEAPGPETGNARPYDNVNDYVTAIGTTTRSFDKAGQLVDAAGQPVYANDGTNMLGNYTATVRIYAGEALGDIGAAPPVSTPADSDVLRISVTVTYAGNRSVTLDGYRTRYAPNALP